MDTQSSFDGQTNNAFITLYNSDGSKAWTKFLGGSAKFLVGSDMVWASSLTTGADGAIYVAGDTNSRDVFVIKLASPYSTTGTVTINGTAKLGQVLTATNNLADSDGIGTLSYQWQADGVNIHGATNSTLTLTQAQVGKSLSVVASHTDGAGNFEQVTSSNVQVILLENFTLITKISPSDTALGKAPKFALSGTDAHLFKISTKGALSFAAAPDYEQAIDSNKDGTYEVSVVMTNSKTGYMLTNDFGVFVEFAAIQGTANADTLKGTKGWDTLDGLAGNDNNAALNANDVWVV